MDAKQQLRAFLGIHQTTGWLIFLMGVGLLIEILLILIVGIISNGNDELFRSIISYLILPTKGSDYLFKPWTIFTYPFFIQGINYSSLLRLLFDGLILWTFGRIHQQLLGDTRTRRLVILAVPIIGLLTVLICTLVPIYVGPTIYLSGISVVMITLTISCITLVPDYPIQLFLLGRVKILWIGIVILLIELSYTFYGPQGIAVMLAALIGFFHIILLRRGTDITELIWSYYQDKDSKPRMMVKYGSKSKDEFSNKSNKSKSDSIPQDVIDGILDKISDKGYESLTREEKELLFRASSQKDNEK